MVTYSRPVEHDRDMLEKEYAAAMRAGLSVERVKHSPLTHFDTGACLRFAMQAQFHPLKYLVHLANSVAAERGSIFCQTRAKQIEGGDEARVVTEAGPVVKAKHIVVATNTPVNDLVAIHTKQAPYLSYVIGARVPKGAVEPALYWDTADPFHYVRTRGRARGLGLRYPDRRWRRSQNRAGPRCGTAARPTARLGS